MAAMPERVEEQQPGGEPVAPLAADGSPMAEERRDLGRLGDFRYAVLRGDQRAESFSAAFDPFADRHREATFGGERGGDRQVCSAA